MCCSAWPTPQGAKAWKYIVLVNWMWKYIWINGIFSHRESSSLNTAPIYKLLAQLERDSGSVFVCVCVFVCVLLCVCICQFKPPLLQKNPDKQRKSHFRPLLRADLQQCVCVCVCVCGRVCVLVCVCVCVCVCVGCWNNKKATRQTDSHRETLAAVQPSLFQKILATSFLKVPFASTAIGGQKSLKSLVICS